MAAGEWQIRGSLSQDLEKYRRRGEAVPDKLDEDVFLRFAALLKKSSRPGQHSWLLREYYSLTRDFRLLETLPEAVLGQTRAKVYDFLKDLGSLLQIVEDEATVDRMEKFLRGLLEKNPSAVDRRALRLLEFLVEKRAAAQADGAGPHVEAALAALKEAWKGSWEDGEPILMAELLVSLETVAPALREEVFRELREIHDGARAGSEERLRIAGLRARSLRANEHLDEATRVLEAALDERRQARGALEEDEEYNLLATYASYLVDRGEFLGAEKAYRDERARTASESRRRWFDLRILDVLGRALEKEGTTSLGKGIDLYRGARDAFYAALSRRTHESHARELVVQFTVLMQKANRQKIAEAGRDLRDFAFGKLPEVLRMYQYREGQTMVSTVAENLRAILNPRESLSFYVVRAETEPAWLRRRGEDFWGRHGHRFAETRSLVKDLGDLEPRVLSIFLEEVRRDLVTRSSRSRYGYHRQNDCFWAEKADDFFRLAREVLAENRDSEGAVNHIAQYLFRGLDRKEEAVAALFELERKGKLGQEVRWRLARYLQESGRFQDSIPVIQEMVKAWPDSVDYRKGLLRAYFKTGDSGKLNAGLQEAEDHFRKKDLWNEGSIAGLGAAALECELFEKAATLYEEAISLRRKGLGKVREDETLSGYYGNLARAWSGLGKTKEAADAAAGAIVSWGKRQEKRAEALKALVAVLRAAKDLDAYAESLDRESRDLKLENPTLRKALGKAYIEKKEWAKAILHLEAALESAPDDPEIAKALIEAHEGSGDKVAAAARLRALARARGHDLALFQDLGERLSKLERPDEAERAFTNLAELSANESEGRQLLAGIREKQGRFLDAAGEWRQVVRVRSREPGGYLGLARSLITAGRAGEAREHLRFLLGRSWDSRFGDVHGEARKLHEKAEAANR